MKRWISGLLAAVLAGGLAACGGTQGTGPAAPAASAEKPLTQSGSAPGVSAGSAPERDGERVELMVSAAASLTDCMQELAVLYEAEQPVKLTFNFGASGTLQQQIEQGAPADVFISAGQKQMDALVEGGLMESDTVSDILENKVVLITPAGAPPLTFGELAGDAVGQLGVGEPGSVPVGQYTAEILESMGLAEALQPKLVYAKDVREVLSWVETKNVEAGIVYETDAKISDKVQIADAAPEGSHKKVIYPIGVTKDSQAKQEARELVAFLTGSELADEVFTKYGFTTLRTRPDA